MREVRKSVKRKLVSESSESDSEESVFSSGEQSPKRRRETEDSENETEDDADKTLRVSTSATSDKATNNNTDVIADIDQYCASGEETQPLTRNTDNWMELASGLTREEKQSISDKFSAELRLLSTGDTKGGSRHPNHYHFLQGPQEMSTTRLLLKGTVVIKVINNMGINLTLSLAFIIKGMNEVERMQSELKDFIDNSDFKLLADWGDCMKSRDNTGHIAKEPECKPDISRISLPYLLYLTSS